MDIRLSHFECMTTESLGPINIMEKTWLLDTQQFKPSCKAGLMENGFLLEMTQVDQMVAI